MWSSGVWELIGQQAAREQGGLCGAQQSTAPGVPAPQMVIKVQTCQAFGAKGQRGQLRTHGRLLGESDPEGT